MDEVERSATVGSAEQIAEELGGYDVDLVVCRVGYDQPPRTALVEVIERIGQELLPLAIYQKDRLFFLESNLTTICINFLEDF